LAVGLTAGLLARQKPQEMLPPLVLMPADGVTVF
jgi:hypothetical protein